MVKTVLGVSHRGLRDWVIQRISAVMMAVYTIGLVGYVVCHPELTFAEWSDLFAQGWVKVATILVVLALLFHAWVGMWTILTDYVKNFILSCILKVVVLLVLAASFFWAFSILWSV